MGLRKVNGLTKSTPLNTLHLLAAEPPREFKAEFFCLKYIIKLKFHNNIVYKQLQKNLSQDSGCWFHQRNLMKLTIV